MSGLYNRHCAVISKIEIILLITTQSHFEILINYTILHLPVKNLLRSVSVHTYPPIFRKIDKKIWAPKIKHYPILIDIFWRVREVYLISSGQLLLKFYHAYIESALEYGSIANSSAAPSILARLNVIRNSGLRIATTWARKTSPIPALYAEVIIITPSFHCHSVNTKFFIRCCYFPATHPLLEMCLTYKDLLNTINDVTFPHIKPFFLRAQDSFTSLSLD